MAQLKKKERNPDGSISLGLREAKGRLNSLFVQLKNKLVSEEAKDFMAFALMVSQSPKEHFFTIAPDTLQNAQEQMLGIFPLHAQLDREMRLSPKRWPEIVRLGQNLGERIKVWEIFVPKDHIKDNEQDMALKDFRPIKYLKKIVYNIKDIGAALKIAREAANLQEEVEEGFEPADELVSNELSKVPVWKNPTLADDKEKADKEYKRQKQAGGGMLSQKMQGWRAFVEDRKNDLEGNNENPVVVVCPLPPKPSAPGSASPFGMFFDAVSQTTRSFIIQSSTLSPPQSFSSSSQTTPTSSPMISGQSVPVSPTLLPVISLTPSS